MSFPTVAMAQTAFDDSTRLALLDSHRALSFTLHAIIGAFVVLRLGVRWRSERIARPFWRALAPAGAYTASAMCVVLFVWLLWPVDTLALINAASMIAFLGGVGAGSAAGWGVVRSMQASVPERPSLEDEIARRLSEISKESGEL